MANTMNVPTCRAAWAWTTDPMPYDSPSLPRTRSLSRLASGARRAGSCPSPGPGSPGRRPSSGTTGRRCTPRSPCPGFRCDRVPRHGRLGRALDPLVRHTSDFQPLSAGPSARRSPRSGRSRRPPPAPRPGPPSCFSYIVLHLVERAGLRRSISSSTVGTYRTSSGGYVLSFRWRRMMARAAGSVFRAGQLLELLAA